MNVEPNPSIIIPPGLQCRLFEFRPAFSVQIIGVSKRYPLNSNQTLQWDMAIVGLENSVDWHINKGQWFQG